VKLVSIRTHSWFSLLEGVDPPATLAEAAAARGYEAIGITDTNSLAGAVELCQACKGHGVRPLVGARLACGAKRCTVLVAEPAGYHNLCKVISRCNLDARADLLETLSLFAGGLHALVDQPAALTPSVLDAFRGRLWVELARPGMTAQQEHALIEAGSKVGARPAASLAARMAGPEGYGAHRLVAAVRRGTTLGELPAVLGVRRENHIAEAAEVRDRFRDLPMALANAAALSEQCRSDVLPRGAAALPVKVPHGVGPIAHLARVCEAAMTRLNLASRPAARRRLTEELDLIGVMGLAGYFLVCGEVAEEAGRQSWPMSLRGSAGCSLVCHLLGLTPADPVEAGLRIERFLNPGREKPPDIDMEFASRQRRLVLRWLITRYGDDNVARVGCYAHFRAGSLRAALKANGLSDDQVDAVRDPFGELEGMSDGRLEATPPAWPGEADGWAKALADARALEGRPYRLDAHPSKVVVAADPVGSLCPVEPWSEFRSVRLTQLDADSCPRVGLATFDLLASRALGALADGSRAAADLSAPEGSEQGVASLLASGDALGVPQAEAPLTRRVLMQARPRGVRELADGLALARPGAAPGRELYLRRRHGAEPIRYVHERAEAALRETLGVLLYDDDAITLIESVAGLTGVEADRLRRLFAGGDGAAEATAQLAAACSQAGVPEQAARAVAAGLRNLEAYTFCKAHGLAVARVAWDLCLLRASCPVAFWASCLNNHGGHFSTWVYVEAAKRDGVTVLPPCANRSAAGWTQEVSSLRAGLDSIRGLDPGAAAALAEDRQRGGRYSSFEEAKKRLTVAHHDLAALVLAGCFDFTGQGRKTLLAAGKLAGRGLPSEAKKKPRSIPPWPPGGVGRGPHGRCAEWEMLGFATGPPMMAAVRGELPCRLGDSRALRAASGREQLALAGLVAAGEGSSLVLLDEFGLADVDLTPGVELPAEGQLVIVEGAVEMRHGAATLRAQRAEACHPGVIPTRRQGAA
jgi:DNA polymerase III alpha subunit